jgi:hypothetical protein
MFVRLKSVSFFNNNVLYISASRISRQLAHESVKVVSPKRRSRLPPGDTPGNHLC